MIEDTPAEGYPVNPEPQLLDPRFMRHYQAATKPASLAATSAARSSLSTESTPC